MNTKERQTAIEWLVENMQRLNQHENPEEWNKLFQQAKAMEKEQIIDAFGVGCEVESKRLIGYHGMAEQYYNETYNI